MRYSTTGLTEFKGIKVGSIRTEHSFTKAPSRYVMCKGIELGEDGNHYAHWQYVLKRTLKPSGKSTSFLTIIN